MLTANRLIKVCTCLSFSVGFSISSVAKAWIAKITQISDSLPTQFVTKNFGVKRQVWREVVMWFVPKMPFDAFNSRSGRSRSREEIVVLGVPSLGDAGYSY
jgi:hypothetical protein